MTDRRFPPPFQPVQILREAGPYGRMLNLVPGVAIPPDPEFLVRLLSDHSSHQAYLRQAAGSHYKNLEHHIRAKHKVSQTSVKGLVEVLGLPAEQVEGLRGTAPNGPLMPALLSIFQLAEGLPSAITSSILKTIIPCPCCGKNLLDSDAWWSRHGHSLGRAEYQFAERLLRAIVGTDMLRCLAQSVTSCAENGLPRLDSLADPLRHPIGNWLRETYLAMSCNSLAELATAMQLRHGVASNLTHARLKKWSAGTDVISLEVAESIAQAAGHFKDRMIRLRAARAIALVIEFVAASLPAGATTTTRACSQRIIFERMASIYAGSWVALNPHAKLLPRQ